jgi:hypothetical protein
VSGEHDPQPPDPAGTQPKVDRDALLPARIEPPTAEQPPRDEAPLPEPAGPAGGIGEPAVLHEAPHAARFQFILGALLAIGAIAIAGLIWSVGQTGDPDGPAWSPWKPSDSGLEGAQQIAAHVGPQYRTNGSQLVHVTASEMQIGNIDLELVERETADEGGEVARLDGDAVLFRLCGLGERCAIRGTPTKSRGLLLRREAIEIAGYAFRYLPGIDYTVFFMPPASVKVDAEEGKAKETVRLGNHTLVFRRGDLAPILEAPLRATLKAPPPPVNRVRKAPEAPLVSALAARGEFFYSFSQGEGDDSAFLVLDRQPQASQIEAAVEEAKLDAATERLTRSSQAGR